MTLSRCPDLQDEIDDTNDTRDSNRQVEEEIERVAEEDENGEDGLMGEEAEEEGEDHDLEGTVSFGASFSSARTLHNSLQSRNHPVPPLSLPLFEHAASVSSHGSITTAISNTVNDLASRESTFLRSSSPHDTFQTLLPSSMPTSHQLASAPSSSSFSSSSSSSSSSSCSSASTSAAVASVMDPISLPTLSYPISCLPTLSLPGPDDL